MREDLPLDSAGHARKMGSEDKTQTGVSSPLKKTGHASLGKLRLKRKQKHP